MQMLRNYHFLCLIMIVFSSHAQNENDTAVKQQFLTELEKITHTLEERHKNTSDLLCQHLRDNRNIDDSCRFIQSSDARGILISHLLSHDDIRILKEKTAREKTYAADLQKVREDIKQSSDVSEWEKWLRTYIANQQTSNASLNEQIATSYSWDVALCGGLASLGACVGYFCANEGYKIPSTTGGASLGMLFFFFLTINNKDRYWLKKEITQNKKVVKTLHELVIEFLP